MSFSSTSLELSQLEDFLLLNALLSDHQIPTDFSSNQLITNTNDSINAALEWPGDELLDGIESAWCQQVQSSDQDTITDTNFHTHISNPTLLMSDSVNNSRTNEPPLNTMLNSSSTLFHSRNVISPSQYSWLNLLRNIQLPAAGIHASSQLYKRSNQSLEDLKWTTNFPVNPRLSCCLNDLCPAEDEQAFARSCMSVINSKKPIRAPSNGVNLKPKKLNWCKNFNVTSDTVRPKQMTRLFYTLRALLPQQVPQNDKCRLIEETCDYIRELEKKLELLRRKAKILRATMKMSNVAMDSSSGRDKVRRGSPNPKNVNGGGFEGEPQQMMGGGGTSINDIYRSSDGNGDCEKSHVRVACEGGGKVVNICMGCHKRVAGLFSAILIILERRGLEVISANRSQNSNTALYVIHTKATESSTLSSISIRELQEELQIEVASKL